MMIHEKVARLLEEQVTHELAASQQYLAMAIYFGHQGLDKWAALFFRQSDEERMHALKIVHFLVEVGAEFKLGALAEVRPDSFSSPLDICQKALKWEKGVTDNFRKLNKVAQEEHDAVTTQFLTWFLNEQVEEENTMDRLVKILESGLNAYMAEQLLVVPAGAPTADGAAPAE